MSAGSTLSYRTRVTTGDLAQIEALVARTGVFNAEEISIARELAAEALTRGSLSGYEFMIVDGADGIEAYTCFGPIPGSDRRYELYWIAVDPRAQRKGLARALLTATEKEALGMGAVRLYAETSGLPAYAPAHAFYSRMGYRLCATVEDYHADGDALVIFEKKL